MLHGVLLLTVLQPNSGGNRSEYVYTVYCILNKGFLRTFRAHLVHKTRLVLAGVGHGSQIRSRVSAFRQGYPILLGLTVPSRVFQSTFYKSIERCGRPAKRQKTPTVRNLSGLDRNVSNVLRVHYLFALPVGHSFPWFRRDTSVDCLQLVVKAQRRTRLPPSFTSYSPEALPPHLSEPSALALAGGVVSQCPRPSRTDSPPVPRRC